MSVFSLGSMHPMGDCYDDQTIIVYQHETKVDEKAEETRSGHYVADCTRHGRVKCHQCPNESILDCDPNIDWQSGCYNPVWKYYPE